MHRYHYLLVTIVLLALVGCAGQSTPSGLTAESIEALSSTIEATGVVVPETWTVISFSVGGRVAALPVEAGDQVYDGRILARLDNTDAGQAVKIAQLKISQAEVNVKLAQDELHRIVTWSPDKYRVAAAEAAANNAEAALEEAQSAYDKVAWVPSVSSTQQSLQLERATNDYDLAQSNLDYLYSNRPDVKKAADHLDLTELSLQEAQLNLEVAQEALDKMTLTAPFFGTINRVFVHKNEVVAPGTPIMTISDLSTLHIETTDLNENDVVNIAIGDKVSVTFEAMPGVEVEGTVTEIGTRSEEGVGVNFTVTVDLSEAPQGLRWGMTAYVNFPSKH